MAAEAKPFVRADVQAFLDGLKQTPRPVFTAELLKMIRTIHIDPAMLPDLPVGDLAEIRDVVMPGPGGDIALRLFDARATRGPGPVMVFYHGGGFAVGSIDMHAGLAAEIARALDLPVVSVEYRLAPEHPWPAAPDDAEAAARWIAENGAAFDRDFTSLVLCGDSAGGNLAIVTSLALRDSAAALPVIMQVAIYPVVDFEGGTESRRLFADGYGLEPENMALYDQHYAPDIAHWRASPLRADQTGMPPTLVVTASLDPLRDEGRAYAGATIAAGVPTTFHEFEGTIHGFAIYRRLVPSARDDLARLLRAANAMLMEITAKTA